jgi:hypothetical protein
MAIGILNMHFKSPGIIGRRKLYCDSFGLKALLQGEDVAVETDPNPCTG